MFTATFMRTGRGREEESSDNLREWLTEFCLRRTKETRDEEGKPLLALPARNIHVLDVQFSDAEADFYQAIEHHARLSFEREQRQGRLTHAVEFGLILTLLLRWRQACLHIQLATGDMGAAEVQRRIDDLETHRDMVTSQDLPQVLNQQEQKPDLAGVTGSGEATAEERAAFKRFSAKVKKRLQQATDLQCPICMDVPLPADALVTACGHIFCRECTDSIFKDVPQADCPNCRAPIQKRLMAPGTLVRPDKALVHVE